MSDDVLFFGCWNEPGHYLFGPSGRPVCRHEERAVYYGDHIHIDGTLAPRRHQPTNSISWLGAGATKSARDTFRNNSSECPQGQFLLHHLENGYTAIQWWDRCQGDSRGACNSTSRTWSPTSKGLACRWWRSGCESGSDGR